LNRKQQQVLKPSRSLDTVSWWSGS
jgi:hypothetical protein